MFSDNCFILVIVSVLYVQCSTFLPVDTSCNFDTDTSLSDNIEQCIDDKLFELKNDIFFVLEPLSAAMYNIQKSTDEINMVTKNINPIPAKTDSNSNENAILESINLLNNRLDAIEIVLHNKFVELENNIKKEYKDLSETVKTSLAANSKLITGKIGMLSSENTVRESVISIYNRLNILENITSHQEHNIEKLLNKTNLMGNLDIQSKVSKEENMLCADYKGKSIDNEATIIKRYPVKDNLDNIVIKQTGCAYSAIGPYSRFKLPEITFNGTQIEWLVAVKAYDEAYVHIDLSTWNTTEQNYVFIIGLKKNTVTSLYQWTDTKLLSRLDTPGILSPDRYAAFYIKINEDTLSISDACTSKLLFSRNITINVEQTVKFNLRSQSKYGAKFLYDCPADVLGKS